MKTNYGKNEVPLSVGDIISTPTHGVVEHFGVVTEYNTVVSNSKTHGRVVEQSISDFSANGKIVNYGAWGNLPRWKIAHNAQSLIGQKYDLMRNNCEHLVRKVTGIRPTSPQLLFAGFLSAVALCGLFKAKIR